MTLFAFGRTIHCTCGARVGLEHRLRFEVIAPRFTADAMLGRLVGTGGPVGSRVAVSFGSP